MVAVAVMAPVASVGEGARRASKVRETETFFAMVGTVQVTVLPESTPPSEMFVTLAGSMPAGRVSTIVTASAGEGYFRHAKKWGAEVLLTGETEPAEAVRKILAREPLAKARFDITTSFCKVIDLFSSH